MKIKTKPMEYSRVNTLPKIKRKRPMRPIWLLQIVIRLLSIFTLRPLKFTFRKHGMEKLRRRQPTLILMNHSCFTDLQIASRIFFPRRYSIVCTSDGFVGMPWLMRLLGCIATNKFVNDITLIQDMSYMLKKKKTSVLLFPEASYSFDGTATPLPRKLGILLKKLDVPVVSVITHGAFAHQPLYNGLQKRKVQVDADVTYLLTQEQIRERSVAELDAILDETFTFDNFAWQQENGVVINEPFRADGLNRILFRCPHCQAEGQTEGKGISLTCHGCGKTWTLTEIGSLQANEGETEFTHIPDWNRWQRETVRKALEDGSYKLDVPVKIGMMVDYKAIYMVGTGRLIHSIDGFHLSGCDGQLEFSQPPLACYGLYADYHWYEIGDVICIGNRETLYYCFPQEGDVVAKTRLAVEELYKLKKAAGKRSK